MSADLYRRACHLDVDRAIGRFIKRDRQYFARFYLKVDRRGKSMLEMQVNRCSCAPSAASERFSFDTALKSAYMDRFVWLKFYEIDVGAHFPKSWMVAEKRSKRLYVNVV